MARDDEDVADKTDNFEVYVRKTPRPEADPAKARAMEREAAAAPVEDTPSTFYPGLPDPPAQPMTVEPSRLARFTGASVPSPASAPLPARNAPSASQSHAGSTARPTHRGNTMRIAIAATEFNYDIVHMMVERARSHAAFLGADVSHVVRVPGSYDLPLAAKRLLARQDVDGVVALGAVIEGETDHDDLVIQHAARKLIDLSLEFMKPVGFGVTGPGMSRLQAEARIDRAKDAVEAVVKLHRTLAPL